MPARFKTLKVTYELELVSLLECPCSLTFKFMRTQIRQRGGGVPSVLLLPTADCSCCCSCCLQPPPPSPPLSPYQLALSFHNHSVLVCHEIFCAQRRARQHDAFHRPRPREHRVAQCRAPAKIEHRQATAAPDHAGDGLVLCTGNVAGRSELAARKDEQGRGGRAASRWEDAQQG